jgi:hypothetical protein
MRNWISDLLIFSGGVACGLLIAGIQRYFLSVKRKRSEMVAARAGILAGIKVRHDKEILDEAFRTTEAIRGELNRSLQTLRKTLTAVLDPAKSPSAEPNQIVQASKPVEPKQSAS